MILTVYYYGEDPNITYADYLLDPPDDGFYNGLGKFPLYDNDFNKVGYLIRNVKYIYEPIDNSEQTNDLYILDFTIYFYNTNNTISFSQALKKPYSSNSLYEPYVPVRSLIKNCTGDIYYRTGTVELMGFDNKITSRMITITLN